MTSANGTPVSAALAQDSFRCLQDAFSAARAQAPAAVHTRTCEMVERPVHMTFVGDALADYFQRAFAQLPSADSSASGLRIALWDETAAGVPNPVPLRSDDPTLPHYSDGELVFVDETGRFVWTEQASGATWFDRKQNQILGWRADGTHPPTYEQSKPLTFMVALWLHHLGIEVLHAGLVARGENGVLIAGGTGIGKTSTALACLLAGFDYLGDDQIPVEVRGGANGAPYEFIGHCVYHSARLEPDNLHRFPSLQAAALSSRDPLDRKSLVLLAALYPERMARRARVRALVLPRVTGQPRTTWRRARPMDVMQYCARTSIFTPWGFGRGRFETLTRLVGGVPCYWLEAGTDLSTIPPVMDSILEQA